MLKEIHDALQPADEPRRRCFSDPDADLFVWYDDQDNVIQFQICYDRGPDEKAYTWSLEHGVVHHGVDDGSRSGRYTIKGSPVLTGTRPLDPAPLIALFRERGIKLEHDLHEFIARRLAESHG